MNGEFLYKKVVDKSVLIHGITIPIKYHQQLYDKFGFIERGTSKNLKVWIKDESFDVTLLHVDFKKEIREVLQIRYSSSRNGLPKLLRETFPSTAEFVRECDRCKDLGLPAPKQNESNKEYLDVEGLKNEEVKINKNEYYT